MPAPTRTVLRRERGCPPITGTILSCRVCSASSPAPPARSRGTAGARARPDRAPGVPGLLGQRALAAVDHPAGQPDLDFTAHWATRPWLDTWYYAGRIGLWKANRGWIFDFTHHKIYLSNNPPEVQKFRITNGMNMFTLSRGFRRGQLTYAIGAGPVITFPINRVRDQKLAERPRISRRVLPVRRHDHGER